MTVMSPCPDREALERLILGAMSDLEMMALEGHVSWCPRCLEVVRDVKTEDGLIQAVRAGGTTEAVPPDALDEGLIARLCQLRLQSVATLPAPGSLPPADRTKEVAGLLAPPRELDELGRIGPYGILRVLGSGGMGIVFAARQQRPRRVIALKMILSGPRSGRGRLERFRGESEIIAGLRHPNIVRVHEVGEHLGWP
jgi:eukaryotic-like serine/threonine-protein kinase